MLNYRITVTRQGPSPEEIEKQILTQFIKIQETLNYMAVQTVLVMRQAITDKKRRKGSENVLEKSIDVEIVEATRSSITLGIGNISKLPPYWYLINYGGYTTIAARGMILWGWYGSGNKPDPSLRGTGVGTEKFTAIDSPNSFRMKPKNPVPAFHYIEKGRDYLNDIIRVHKTGWTGKIQAFGR